MGVGVFFFFLVVGKGGGGCKSEGFQSYFRKQMFKFEDVFILLRACRTYIITMLSEDIIHWSGK